MATKEITKQQRYSEPELERELELEPDSTLSARERWIHRIGLLWQNRRWLLRRAIAGAVASVVIALLLPVRYTSTTRLMPPDQAGQGISAMLAALGKGEMGAIGGELLGVKTSGDLFVGVLHSRTVQDAVVKKFDLRKLYGTKRYEDARKVLEAATDVSADRKSAILTIKVTDKDPARAAAMAHEYVDALNDVVINLNTSAAHKERVFLENRLQGVQQDLEQAEKDFSKFASQNTAIDVKEQGRAMISAAAELQGQLIAAETQLEGLRQIYTPENIRVRQMQARIDEFKRQLKKMGGQSGDNPPSAADSAASQTSQNSSELYPSIRQLPILGVTWADLYRNTKVQETIFETLTKQYELAKVEEARETPSVKVLDPADVPERKSFPPRTLIVLLGTCFVLALASAWLLVKSVWEKVDPSDPGKILVNDIIRGIRGASRGALVRMGRGSARGGETDTR